MVSEIHDPNLMGDQTQVQVHDKCYGGAIALRLLIFGANGMLGHKLYQVAKEEGHEVFGSMREPYDSFASLGVFEKGDIYDKTDVRIESDLKSVFAKCKPEVVVNCAGIVKPRLKDPVEGIEVNSILPHKLSLLCGVKARLVQVSTDCVFSGIKGNYSEDDLPDPIDLYGRSKLLGEVTTTQNSLTVRTSMIGRELGTRRNLLEWFLNQKGEVKGFTNAIFSGPTTLELSRIILKLVRGDLSGLIHVSAQPINKFDLLHLIKKHFRLDTSIVPYPDERIDRSLQSPRLEGLGIHVPSWNSMVKELAEENQFYEQVNKKWQRKF
jgi:dTDP-4-dehydrorhamnose reductase